MFVAPFMGLFFGLCLGDGAYGLLLLIASLLLSIKFKDNRSALPFIQLLVMLGIFATVIGLLMGKVFGVDIAKPLGLQTPLLLYGLTNDPKNFFIFALALGGIQVFFGMLLKLIDMIRNAQWQNCLGVLGWMSLYPIGFLIYKGHSASLMLISLVAIFLFNDPDPSLGKRLGKGTWALYNVTSLFGDIMSYVRIFGLGLSSGIIAYVFNMIAGILWGIHPAFGPLVAIILLIFGHSFNFIMATIGAMVHSARLNFLEFYGKFFVGGGKAYSPFGAQRDRN
jgi:V/A-type H+-transporting ATPase subunit I